MLRDIPANHPIIGNFYRKLTDDEVLQIGDETACVSTLFSKIHTEGWRSINNSGMVGKTVAESYEEDADAQERIYRRKLTSFAVVHGSLLGGYQACGPFPTVEGATKWAEERESLLGFVSVMELVLPEKHPIQYNPVAKD